MVQTQKVVWYGGMLLDAAVVGGWVLGADSVTVGENVLVAARRATDGGGCAINQLYGKECTLDTSS